MQRAVAVALAIVLVTGAAGCRRASDAPAPSGGRSASRATAGVATQPAYPDVCRLVSAREFQRLLGPIEGAPVRGHSADDPERDDQQGRACVFTPVPRDGIYAGTQIAVGLELEDAAAFEMASPVVTPRVARQTGLAPGDAEKASAPPDGWDYTGGTPEMYVGRVGHVAVEVGLHGQPRVPWDSVARLAALVRDRLRDVPFQAPRGSASSTDGPDPCALLTRDEVERVLGPLAIAPYHSAGSSALASERGEGCSYYLGKHRVFTVSPTWEQGKQRFGLTAGFNQKISATVGVAGAALDTLQRSWDRVGAGVGGEPLYFLKGDRMLTVVYRASGADALHALRLAATALRRM